MKQSLSILLFLYLSINYVDCQISNRSLVTTLFEDDDQCPLWHFFDTTTQLCECYNSPSTNDIVKCTEQGINLRVGHCMTYEEPERTIYIAPCPFTSDNFSTSSKGQFIEIPIKNASELNDYMCEQINRRGRVCSECIEDYGMSIISFGVVCSNCTGVWYGVPLYLFLEFVPITIFYVIILIFKVNITSAPMVAYVFFCQIIVSTFLDYGVNLKFEHPIAYSFALVLVTSYGFWNLDFFRYILPPFCVTPELKFMHIIVIDYVSAFYPLCLICITWTIIQLHFRNFRPIVWLWSKLSKCSCINTQNNSVSRSNSLIDAFTTFFLLSYSKLVFASSRVLSPLNAMVYRNNTLSNTHKLTEDPRISYFGKEHLIYALISIFIVLFTIVPPALLLILYPIKVFRLLLFKCRLSTRTLASLNIFVEKYYSCYRDGTDGGTDMRSLASMYFILRWISILIFQMASLSASLILVVILFVSYGIVIALVRPYKKTYMNVIDTLILTNLGLLALMMDKYYLENPSTLFALLYASILCIFGFLPLLGLSGFIAYKILRRIKIELDLYRTKKHVSHQCSNKSTTAFAEDLQSNNSDRDLPDCLLHPKQYSVVDMKDFEDVNYVKAS